MAIREGIAMSDTTQKMKSKIIIKTTKVRKDPGAPARSLEYAPEVKLCIERGRLYTEAYRTTDGTPEVIRRAMALTHVLENMTIYIEDGQRIVGNCACDEYSLPIYPEIAQKYLLVE